MNSTPAGLRSFNRTRWVIYLLVLLAVTLPFLGDTRMTFEPSPWARKLYDRVEALPPGSRILLSFDFEPSTKAELAPMAAAILQHCFRKNLVPVIMTNWINGVGLADFICKQAAVDAQSQDGKPRQSGTDYVFLGFRPGGPQLILNMGGDLKNAFDKDFDDHPTKSLAALTGIDALKDFPLIIDIAAGKPGAEEWILYGSDRFGVPLGVGSSAVQSADLYPFLNSNQIVGFLAGLRGAADYETLLKSPAEGTRRMPAQSSVQILMVLLILAPNLYLLVKRFTRKVAR